MSAALLPCPFCAATGRETTEADADYPVKCFAFIKCTRCGARTAGIYGTADPSEWADARENWNQRTVRTLPASDTILLDSLETSESEARTPGALWLDLPIEKATGATS